MVTRVGRLLDAPATEVANYSATSLTRWNRVCFVSSHNVSFVNHTNFIFSRLFVAILDERVRRLRLYGALDSTAP